MVDPINDLHKIPSKKVLKNRRAFFGLWRRCDDKTSTWLERVQNQINNCDFPTNIMEFLLFHRFICELNANELESVRKVSKSWTLKQLLEHFLIKNIDSEHMEADLTENKIFYQNQNLSLDIVKSEPVCLSFVRTHFHIIFEYISILYQ